MKAAVFHTFGAPDVLKYEDVETPRAHAGNVIIRVIATGVNRLEHYLREGSVLQQLPMPHILGSDAVGEITEIGEGVTGFRLGERVIPMPGYPLDSADDSIAPISAAPTYAIGGILRWGTYAEFIEVPAKWVLKAPASKLSAEELATLPMVLVTGVRAVKTVGGVRAGDRVLVHAASSGTGAINIQIAKALGAKVATTVDSASKVGFARDLGADLVIDVSQEDFVEAGRKWTDGKGFDVVIDNLGGDILRRSIDSACVGGTIVAMGFVAGVEVEFHVRDFFFTHKRLLGTLMGDVADLQWGLDLVAEGKIKPSLDRILPLSAAAEAHALVASNTLLGNVVLKP